MFPARPPTPPLKPASPPQPAASSSRGPPSFTGPLDALGKPIPGGDPTAAWERQRAAWLARRRPEGQKKAEPKDAAFKDKLVKLEDLLSGRSAARDEASGGEKAEGGGRESAEDEDEPDGGMVVGRVGKGGEKEGELRKAGEVSDVCCVASSQTGQDAMGRTDEADLICSHGAGYPAGVQAGQSSQRPVTAIARGEPHSVVRALR